jgi:hypothetical protein
MAEHGFATANARIVKSAIRGKNNLIFPFPFAIHALQGRLSLLVTRLSTRLSPLDLPEPGLNVF